MPSIETVADESVIQSVLLHSQSRRGSNAKFLTNLLAGETHAD